MSKSFQKGKDDDQTKKNAIFQLCLDVDPGDVERCRSVLVIMRTEKKNRITLSGPEEKGSARTK